MATLYPREQMHRIRYTKLSPDQILDKLAAASDGPLVARAQGGGVVRRDERGAFKSDYIRREGIWKIQRTAFRATI